MVSPISSDKVLPQTTGRQSINDGKPAAGKGERTAQSDAPTQTQGQSPIDTVNVSESGRLISQGTEASGAVNTPIENHEQAKSLVSLLRQQIADAGESALQAHGTIQAGQLNALLGSAPA